MAENGPGHEYVQCLLRLDRAGAIDLVERALAEGRDVPAVYSDVLLPAMRLVGQEWEANRLSVAQEHYISEVTRQVIHRLGQRFWVEDEPARPVVVAACVPGERHVLGLMMICDLLRAAGMTVHLLGESAPADTVCDFLSQSAADVLCLSCTLSVHLPEAADLVEMVRAACPAIKVVLGGAAFDGRPEAARAVGADHFAADLNALQAMIPHLQNGHASGPISPVS